MSEAIMSSTLGSSARPCAVMWNITSPSAQAAATWPP
jgi:hypothetical protein